VVIRTQISLTEEQQEALRRVAARRGVSQAAVIREALDDVLSRDDRRRRIERLLAVAGRYHSGLADGRSLARDHDDIYAEILYEDHSGR
jgi:hypothetical protein